MAGQRCSTSLGIPYARFAQQMHFYVFSRSSLFFMCVRLIVLIAPSGLAVIALPRRRATAVNYRAILITRVDFVDEGLPAGEIVDHEADEGAALLHTRG